MYEYIVPQEFDQQDRLGPFTFAQAGIMGGSVLSIMLLLMIGIPLVITLILAIPIMFGALYLMFKKKFGIPIYEFAFVYVTYKATPNLLIYRKDNVEVDAGIEESVVLIKSDDQVGKEFVLNK